MFDLPLEQIEKSHLDALVVDQTRERRTLDYKRDLNLANDGDKRELARDVSSFANAAGGDIVFGVEEAKDGEGKNLGYPGKIVGLANCENFEATKQRLVSILRDNIDPRIQGIDIHKVDGFPHGPVVIVRVPRSWHGPHMVSFANQTHFYSRNAVGKQPLDVREIRNLFLTSSEVEARVRRFRDERLGKILAGETPVELISQSDRPKLVVHAVPLSADVQLDHAALENNRRLVPPMSNSGGWNHRFNLDGFVTYAGPPEGAQRSYSQAFRNGAFEGVSALFAGGPPDVPTLNAFKVETFVINSVEGFRRSLASAGVDAPVVVLVTLLGIRGFRIRLGPEWDDRSEVFDRDVVILPDVLLENADAELSGAFRVTFDALWQASGWPRSLGYDEQGNWDVAQHNRAR